MITIVSINKSSEGLILKSTIRYSWAFKIGNNSHLVEFLEGTMGKKNLYIDSKEKSSIRTFLGKFSEKFLLENNLFEIKPDEDDFDIFMLERNVKFKDLFKKNEDESNGNNYEVKNGNVKSGDSEKNNGDGFVNDMGNRKKVFGGDFGKGEDFGKGGNFGSEWDFDNSKKLNNKNNNRSKNVGNNNFVDDNIDFLGLDSEPKKNVNNNLNNFENFNFGKKNDVDIFNKKKNFVQNVKKNRNVDDFENSKNQKPRLNEDFENFENNPFAEKPKKQKKHNPWGNTENDFTNFDFNDQNLKAKKKYKIFDKQPEKPQKEMPEDIFEDENNFEKAILVHDQNKKEFQMTLDTEKEEKIQDAFYTESDFDNEFEKKDNENKKNRFKIDIDPEESYKNMKKGFKNLFKKTSKLVDKFENKCKKMVYGNTDEKDIEDHVQYHNKNDVNNLGSEIQSFYGGNDINDTISVPFKGGSKGTPFGDSDCRDQLKGLRTETPFLDEFVGDDNLNTPDFGGFDKKNVFADNGFENEGGNGNFNAGVEDKFKDGFGNRGKNDFGNNGDDFGKDNRNEYFSDKNNFQNRKKNDFNNFGNQNKNEDNYLEKVLSSGFLNINEFENTNTTSTPFD